MSDLRFKITRGSDVKKVIRIKTSKGNPKDLTNATVIKFIFDKIGAGEKITLTNITVPAVKAYLKVSALDGFTFTAVTAGKAGNLIKITANGSTSLSDLISAWNTANPSNTVGSDATVDQLAENLPAGEYQLDNGYESYKPVEVINNPIVGLVKIILVEKETNQLKAGNNQSFTVVIDENGVGSGADTFVGVFENRLDVVAT